MWKVPEDIQKDTWSVIEYDLYSIVVPSVDSKPHTTEGYKCSCGPSVEVTGTTHMIVHNSWVDSGAIESSLKGIFG